MSVVSAWVGGVTDTTARVVAKVTGSNVRLAVDTSSLLANPTFYGPVTPTGDGIASITATGLDPDTRYFFAIEEDSILDTQFRGRLRTHPPQGTQASFAFALSGDAGLAPASPGVGTVLDPDAVSNHPVFDAIRTHNADPLFFLHLGDFHYYNFGGISRAGTVENYRRGYDDVLLQPRQHQLYRNVPLVYVWDDHDFGPDNSDRTHPGRHNAAQVYRERVPHYPLTDAGAIYHSFQVGRVLFVVLDLRFERTPDTEPDGPGKMMLGGTQKQWLADVLASSTAEALVVVSTVHWILTTGDDESWGSFATERQELADLFTSTGWADRMVMVSADRHFTVMDSGASNAWGGFPVYGFSCLDSVVHSSGMQSFDVGGFNDRNTYGVISVTDTGDSLTLTVEGYLGAQSLLRHSLTVTVTEADEPPPSPPAPPVSEARARTRVTWLGCDLVTGRIIAELPDVTGPISRVLGAHTSAGLRSPIPLAGPGALGPKAIQATQPGRTMVVAVVNDIPAWGGIVLRRVGGTEATLQLSTVTLEGYLDRRYVRDHTWTNVDEAAVIATGLVGDARIEGIGLIVDAPPTATLRDRTYMGSDDATVYRRLEELMAVEGGPEWTIDLDWADTSQTTIAKIFRMRKRIGRAAAAPTAVFETTAHAVLSSRGASDARYAYTEDYSDGKGANHVIAVSSGEGDDRPTSAPARAEDLIAAGWPRWEERITPSTSIKDVAVLDAHARAELAFRKFGSRTFAITTRWDAIPRYGVDWRLGDTVAWRLTGHRHPDGIAGQGRVIGFDLDMQAGTLQPILWEPDDG